MISSQHEFSRTGSMIDADEITSIVGKPIDDAAVQHTLSNVPGRKQRKKHDAVYHTIYRDYGLEVNEKEGRLIALTLHSKSRSLAEYGGTAPEGLQMTMTREEVRGVLGEPDREMGGLYDQWDRGLYLMTVFYKKGLKVETINLGAA